MEKETKSIGVIYIRVSTEDQAKEGISLESQEEKCKKYAELKDIKIIQTYKDQGKSGKDLNRPELKLMLEAQNYNTIIFYRLDRLSRNLRDLINLSEELGKRKIDIISINENIDTTTSIGRFYFNIVGSFAQLTREKIVEDVIDNQLHLMSKGKHLNRPPIGYKLEKDQQGNITSPNFIIDKPKAETIKSIYNYKSQGMSNSKISRELQLNITTVKNILANKTYTGMLSYRKQWYKAHHKPIISQQDYDTVQKVIEKENFLKAKKTTQNNPTTSYGTIK